MRYWKCPVGPKSVHVVVGVGSLSVLSVQLFRSGGFPRVITVLRFLFLNLAFRFPPFLIS
jgi:hypothetical protein